MILRTLYVLLVLAVSCMFAQTAKDTYQDKCAGCHGPDGAATTARGKKLKMKGVKEVAPKMTADQMTKIVTDGKGADMPAYGKELSNVQVKSVVGYYRDLAK